MTKPTIFVEDDFDFNPLIYASALAEGLKRSCDYSITITIWSVIFLCLIVWNSNQDRSSATY